MQSALAGLEPADLFSHFEDITRIPHGSGNEAAVAQYLMDFAASRGLWARTDDARNVYIKKPASPGCASAPPVLLQGHTDMVCARREDSPHDFTRDPLRLVVEGDILRADGTTLGADDGVAVAYMLTLLARDDYPHPPLECLFTSCEEVGLDGARAADMSCFEARRMINLDAGPDGVLIAGSAGGTRIRLSLEASFEPARGDRLLLHIAGLTGGHSGTEIIHGRGNALKIAGRLLHSLPDGWRLGSVDGGEKDNAIPRSCTVAVYLPDGGADDAANRLEACAAAIRGELRETDPGFAAAVTNEGAVPGRMMTADDTARLCALLYLLPDGVVARSESLGAVVASLNAGVAATAGGTVSLELALRSSEPSLLEEMAGRVRALARILGVEAAAGSSYPGWSYAPDSPLRARCCAAYRAVTGRDMRVEVVHAGLECGLLAAKVPGMDIAALGPDNEGAHTPDERLHISSFVRVFQVLLELMRGLSRE